MPTVDTTLAVVNTLRSNKDLDTQEIKKNIVSLYKIVIEGYCGGYAVGNFIDFWLKKIATAPLIGGAIAISPVNSEKMKNLLALVGMAYKAYKVYYRQPKLTGENDSQTQANPTISDLIPIGHRLIIKATYEVGFAGVLAYRFAFLKRIGEFPSFKKITNNSLSHRDKVVLGCYFFLVLYKCCQVANSKLGTKWRNQRTNQVLQDQQIEAKKAEKAEQEKAAEEAKEAEERNNSEEQIKKIREIDNEFYLKLHQQNRDRQLKEATVSSEPGIEGEQGILS